MALVLIARDPDTDGGDCPALFVDDQTGDLVFQGDKETLNDQVRASVDGVSRIKPGEVLGRIPARMRTTILEALLKLEAADGGAGEDRVR